MEPTRGFLAVLFWGLLLSFRIVSGRLLAFRLTLAPSRGLSWRPIPLLQSELPFRCVLWQLVTLLQMRSRFQPLLWWAKTVLQARQQVSRGSLASCDAFAIKSGEIFLQKRHKPPFERGELRPPLQKRLKLPFAEENPGFSLQKRLCLPFPKAKQRHLLQKRRKLPRD